jgi:hypothetical protein
LIFYHIIDRNGLWGWISWINITLVSNDTSSAALLLIFYHIIDKNGLWGWISWINISSDTLYSRFLPHQVYQKRSEEEANAEAEPIPVALESSPSS